MAIPLQWYGELVGVLAAESEKLDAFSERDETLLGIVANQVAPAVRGKLHRADLGAPGRDAGRAALEPCARAASPSTREDEHLRSTVTT